MVLGVRPLILDSGTRSGIGLVIATGRRVNRFVVPFIYFPGRKSKGQV